MGHALVKPLGQYRLRFVHFPLARHFPARWVRKLAFTSFVDFSSTLVAKFWCMHLGVGCFVVQLIDDALLLSESRLGFFEYVHENTSFFYFKKIMDDSFSSRGMFLLM